MSPVEPSPDVIGTIGCPSPECPGALCFLLGAGMAPDSAGAIRPPVIAPSAPRNVRRLQANFEPMFVFLSKSSLRFAGYFSAAGAGGPTISALPTISINESPGIHSTAMQARDGVLP